jgi:hypothetical protein
MKDRMKRLLLMVCALLMVISLEGIAQAEDSELESLKGTLKQMQQTIDKLNQRIEELEKAKAVPAPAEVKEVPLAKEVPLVQAPAVTGTAAPVTPRHTMNDEQEASPRLGDLTLDPKYQGFIPVPNTRVMIKFNAKPRVDMTWDNQNAGDDTRFITDKIPVDGDPTKGGGARFNINAKGSQFRIDVRAPQVDGSPRFYFQNDFFGSGNNDLNVRVQHIYGQIYNIIVGKTYSVFEDPDVWPDTVDYEGPNSMIFARRELVRYQLPVTKEWYLNFGVEKPQPAIDNTNVDPNMQTIKRWPELGLNARWERSDLGHIQLSTIFRDLREKSNVVGNQSVEGWGVNASAGFDLTKTDAVQGQIVYGEGIGTLGNDSGFESTDAAFSNDQLKALKYWSGMLGYTHHWSPEWRSTVSYGYVHLDNENSQAGTAYHETNYASGNIIWQLRKHLSVGLEGLYGQKKTNNGNEGDVFRLQLGLVYYIFD